MLEKYRKAVDSVDEITRARVCEIMGTKNKLRLPLFTLCVNRGWSQADLVLCLLRVDTTQSLAAASRLVGRPITYCPPVLVRRLPPSALRTGDMRRVTRVSGNPRVAKTDAHRRFAEIRPGRTIAQLISRGVTRRDIREALRRKWMRLENARA